MTNENLINFLQLGHRKKTNPKIRSPINKNVEPLIISDLIEFKHGIYDRKYIPITAKAIIIKILLHVLSFTE